MYTTCKLCATTHEMINHMLFDCDIATELWEVAGLPSPPSGFGDTIEENLTFVLNLTETNAGSNHSQGSIPWFLWIIWKCRNAVLFAGIQESVTVLVQHTWEEAKCWREMNDGEVANFQNKMLGKE